MRPWIAMLAGMFLMGSAFSEDTAQTYGDTVSGVMRLGEYRDLTFARKVKLGTAPYINPSLSRNTAIAYKYRIADIEAAMLTDEGRKKVREALKAGVVAFAEIQENDVYNVVADVATQEDSYVFLSVDDNFLGQSPSGTVVSWNPEFKPAPFSNFKAAELFADPILTDLDTNGDGSINAQEAQRDYGLSRRFSEVDANTDGEVDSAEFSQFELTK